MDKVKKKIDQLTKDFDYLLCYDKEEFHQEIAYDLGTENGRKSEKEDIAKKMLEDNESIEKIIKYTNLTLEEIKQIQKENDQ